MLLDIIYPRRCPVCEDIIVEKGRLICHGCAKKISYVKEPRCKKCGKSISLDEKEYCFDCEKTEHFYDMGLSVFKHNKDIKNSIYRFKYSNKREYGKFYCEQLVNHLGKTIKSWGNCVIIPVPLHKSRKIKRGYNQSEILAEGIGKLLGIEVDKNLLIREKKTVPQKELSVSDRKKNLENAFKINRDIVQYRHVILVDDIYTTGNTIDSCSKVLKSKGVEKVFFITLSIGDGI